MQKCLQIKIISGLILLMTCGSALADHALLADGRILYNVMIPDRASTSGLLVRIRTTPNSFEFDPRTNVVTPLAGHSIIKRLADYVPTTKTVGRAEAAALVQNRSWDRYVPPAREILIAPTPSIKATPIPVAILAKATPVPLNVVKDDIPLQERLDKQLDIFMKEQTRLSQDAVTSVVQGLLTPDQSKDAKVKLLEQQKQILEQYYPQTTETVKLAISYWVQQIERANQTGRFDLENL